MNTTDEKEKEKSADIDAKTAEEETLENVFEKEKENWRAKMVKVFGDLYPCNFNVYGYNNEHVSLAKNDIDKNEVYKIEAVKKLSNMNKIDKSAEEEFNKILSSVETKTVSPSLSEFINKLKTECLKLFEHFDNIVGLCEKQFLLEYEDCSKRMHEAMQQAIIKDVEKYLAEVEEAGVREICHLKDAISSYTHEVGESWSNKIDSIYQDVSNEPSFMEVWNECTEAITSKEIRDAFLSDQREGCLLWKKTFDDLRMLSSELEKCRCNYTMMRSNLQRSIYWMQRNYKDNVPELTTIQRHLSCKVEKKAKLCEVLAILDKEMENEQIKRKDIECQYTKKIANMKEMNEQFSLQANAKRKNIFETKKLEVSSLLNDILNGDRYIFEQILNVSWKPLEVSLGDIGNNERKVNKMSKLTKNESKIKTLKNDEFADAFRLLVSNKDLEAILNYIADNLGFMLDFEWVDYAKKTLEIENEIRWIELFKVFKIDFVKDLSDLKECMMKYTKQNETGELVLDQDGTLDGFLQYLLMKRQPLGLQEYSDEITIKNDDYWQSIQAAIPQIFLWDSVTILLKSYRDLLNSRTILLTSKLELETENTELEKCLQNYYTYDIPNEAHKSM